MEQKEYQKIYKNIDNEKDYEIHNDLLYKIKNNIKLRVIRDYEFEGLMYIVHDHETAGHFGKDATYDRIKEKF